MTDDQFWAKKPYDDGRPPSVLEHCRTVLESADIVWSAIGRELVQSLGLDQARTEETILPLLRAASVLHDMAKVNSAFQSMLRARPGDSERQPVRHEILAAWLLSDPDFVGRWFATLGTSAETWPIIWAIAGHHLKMGDPASTPADPRQSKRELFSLDNAPKEVSIPLPACAALLGEAATILRASGDSMTLPTLPEIKFMTANDDEDSLQERINHFANSSAKAWSQLKRDGDVKLRTALLKALLITSDVAASALIADGRRPIAWASDALRVRITADALQKVVDADLAGESLREFQLAVGNADKPVTLVMAGCGNGKTTAAYLWAKRHAVDRKLWFTYPTTGTASVGYEDYLFTQKEIAADLFHSRAEVDLQAMQSNGNNREDGDEAQVRLESLRAWDRQAIVCTVDTVLGLLQTQRRPLYSFPAIATGAFVFDEIHSYDSRLFGGLLRFLRTFPGAPVLLMSASIPPQRMAELKKVLGDRAGEVIPGDETLEKHQRYRLHHRDSAEACRESVVTALSAGKKVLWVCNTVGDAVKTATEAREWAGIKSERIIVYHSRFRYRDRVTRQKQVIAEFAYQSDKQKRHLRAIPGGSLVITTQVCEMSLDISADLMVTAECPLPALVQRLGRLNRYARKDDPWDCLVYPFVGDPYNEKPELIQMRGDFRLEMKATRDAIRELDGQPCRQCDLAERLKTMFGVEEFEQYSAWLDDGWVTEPAPVRDSDSTITLIREEDLLEIERELGPEDAKPSRWTSRSLVPWTIPMLYRRGFVPARRAGTYPVAAIGAITYNETTIEEGAAWKK